MCKTAVIILAAGNSSRLGRPKQLLPYQGTTLLGHTIHQVRNLSDIDIWVVTGAFHSEVTQSLETEDAQIIYNPEWEMGMGKSLSIAVESIMDRSYDQILVTLSDLPLLDSHFYQAMLTFHLSNENGITRTAYTEVKGVPVIFDRTYFDELQELSSDEGAKVILQKHKERVTDFSWPQPYFDIDTMDSYRELIDRTTDN